MIKRGESDGTQTRALALALVLDSEASSDADTNLLKILASHLFVRGATSVTLIGAGKVDASAWNMAGPVTVLGAGRGQAQVLDAVRMHRSRHGHGEVSVEGFDAAMREVAGPPPDLLIVAGGASHLHGSLTWSAAYAELVFIEKSWRALTMLDIDLALDEFSKRGRRFGGLAEVSPQ